MPRNPRFSTLFHESRQQLLSLIPNAEAGNIYLITGELGLIRPLVQELTDHFAIRGPLRVVVAGNRISFDRMPLHLLDQPSHFEKILDAVKITRGETCYQLLHALQKTTPSSQPLIVMDILQSFYEENLTDKEVDWVLEDSIYNLRRLSRSAPVLVSASPHPSRPNLLDPLLAAATHTINLLPEDPRAKSRQPGLL